MPVVRTRLGQSSEFKTAEMVCFCDFCGKRFYKEKHHLENSDGCFCSRDCRKEFSYRDKYGWNCPYCGGRLEGARAWCGSEECEERMKGHWKVEGTRGQVEYRISIGGSQRLPFNNSLWKKRRSEAMRRDSSECVNCSLSNKEHIGKYGTSLHVHHITPRRSFESAESAHDLDNLVTLCASCHSRVERGDSDINGL